MKKNLTPFLTTHVLADLEILVRGRIDGVLKLPKILPLLSLIALGVTATAGAGATELSTPVAGEDLRRYQHGIDLIVTPRGAKYLFWSSSGNPPTGSTHDGRWTHDVFVAPANAPIRPRTFIAAAEAQEPVSAAMADDGRILVTVEDGAHSTAPVAQRFGLYDAGLNPLLAYPQTVADGGHSGHVAASGNRFVVVYAEGWIAGGGANGLGSGRDIHAKVYDTDGKLRHEIAVATGARNWWPLVAASKRRALIAWQRTVEGETHARLFAAMLDPATGALTKPPWQLAYLLQHYVYSVAYVAKTNRFLVTGTSRKGISFAYLLDESGKILRSRHDLPPFVREATPAINDTEALLLTAPTGAMVLSVEHDRIESRARFDDNHAWQGLGAVADFSDMNSPTVYALSKAGLKLRQLRQKVPRDPRNN